MKCRILMGSPRKQGNTIALTEVVMKELKQRGMECGLTWLYDKEIRGCKACRGCQKDWSQPGCVQKDDMEAIFQEVLESELLILATPIYSWYCTPPVKAALDRMVYAMNKYYGDETGPALWAGKKLALVTTCGYAPEKGADLWEEGVKRYCKHSQMDYLGMLVERHKNYKAAFMDEKKAARAVEFAGKLVKELEK
ncbi:MAG: flavodoxin family protein [Firmicutes bacterium]|nr:flavodoxin family protein [Bacillota bacterium]NBI62041.1 flavodoxin family protein [Clostridiales bacterium]